MMYNAEIGMNNVLVFNEGWLSLKFSDGEEFKLKTPEGSIKGMISGNRLFRATGCVVCVNESKKIKGVIKFGQSAGRFKKFFSSGKTDQLIGSIYEYDEKKHQTVYNKEWLEMSSGMSKQDDKIKELVKISGSWLEKIKFDGEEFWNINDTEGKFKQQNYSDKVLPSNCRFREDLIWQFYGNEEYSQEWKVALEKQQRADKVIRLKGRKEFNPDHK